MLEVTCEQVADSDQMARSFHSSQALRNRVSAYGGSPFPKEIGEPKKNGEPKEKWGTRTPVSHGHGPWCWGCSEKSISDPFL